MEPFKFQYYVAAFIDVLSQKDRLKGMRHLPEGEEETNQFKKLLRETFGTVERLRESLNIVSELMQEPIFGDDVLEQFSSDEDKSAVRAVSDRTFDIDYFSDCAVIRAPLGGLHGPVIGGLHVVLTACSAAMLNMMAGNEYCRGGLDIGIGAQLDSGELYGSALSNAYHLESQVADHPRVAIGPNVIAFLDLIEKIAGNNPALAGMKHLGKMCQRLITTDTDGVPMVHYLNTRFMDSWKKSGHYETLTVPARDNVEANLARFRGSNPKLARRYALVADYFKRSLDDPE